MKRFIISIILTAFLLPAYAAGDSIHDDAGTYGAQYLKINVGAKPVAMGESYTALADDSFGSFWNPAGNNKAEKLDVGFMHNSWISGISQEVAVVAIPLRSSNTFTLGTVMTNMPRIPGADVYGNESESYVAYNMILMASYSSRLFKDNLSAGISVKYLEEAIEKEKATGSCFDLGIKYNHPNAKLSLGASVQNIGQDMVFVSEKFPIPRVYRAGAAYRLMNNKLTIVSDINKAVDANLKYGLGGDYRVRQNVNVRAGLLSNGNITFGFGATYKIATLDYAFVPYEYFGYTHRLSLRLLFDMPEREKKADDKPKTFVTGKVTDKEGNPVTYAIVKMFRNGKEMFRLTTDIKGVYKTPQLPYGSYLGRSGRNGYVSLNKPFDFDKWVENPELNFELEPIKPYSYIYGNITDPGLNPIKDITIRVVRDGSELFRVTTNEFGYYETPELPNGVYLLTPMIKDVDLGETKRRKITKIKRLKQDFSLEIPAQPQK